jgi:hypothetical protein
MSLPARFVLNPAAEKQIASSAEMAGAIGHYTEQGADGARDVAPVLTGAYRDSIETEMGTEGGMVVGVFRATVDYAGWIEFGTADTPAFAPLRRGIDRIQ